MAGINLKIKNGSREKFRVGIIGTGNIARHHVKTYLTFENVEIVALCDIIPGKAEAFARQFGLDSARVYTDHESIIDKEELDCVSVCTYNCQHAAPTVYALSHGVDELLEKPFSATMEDAVAMMRAEKESGRILSIGFQPRFDKNMQMIGKIVKSGALGKIYYIQTGGGSDGNFISARGCPVVDGCGPCGTHLHTADEYLDIPSVAKRYALMKKIINRLF